MPRELTLKERFDLIMAAIHRVETAVQHFKAVNADARMTPAICEDAKAQLANSEREFGWQWRNVRAVLNSLPEEHFDA